MVNYGTVWSWRPAHRGRRWFAPPGRCRRSAWRSTEKQSSRKSWSRKNWLIWSSSEIMKRFFEPIVVATLILLAGCSKYYYNPAPQVLPQHIRSIAVRPFTNHTQQYGLED